MIKTEVIDGVRFEVAPFRSTEALRFKVSLMKTLGPSIGQIMGVLENGLPQSGNFGDIKLDGDKLSKAIEKLMEQLGEDEFEALLRRMFQNVTAIITKDKKVLRLSFTESEFDHSMDMVFQGRLFTVYPVMLFVIRANYPDFFKKLASGIGLKIKKIASSLKDEPASDKDSEESEMLED